jgi:DNA-binding GntR family transcriptional regulator
MQKLSIAVRRENISGELLAEIRNMIVDGHLPEGSRINEVHLAAELGVSRTPLREALARLAQEGALTSVPRIGWFVRPLTLEELEQIYPIRALLDPEALRVAGLPPPARIERLEALNRRILEAEDSEARIALDDRWHLELIAGCRNKVLLDLIRQFILRTRRYELALMRESRNAAAAADTHRDIMAALRRGHLDRACAALRDNLSTGFEPIALWLRERNRERKEAG